MTDPRSLAAIPDAVRIAFALPDAELRAVAGGLINSTWMLDGDGESLIVQRVNPIFAPENHHNIEAVTEHLAARGITTPRLRRTTDNAPYHVHEGTTWRAMTRLPGRAYDTMPSPAHASAAASFVARWHEATEDLEHEFRHIRSGVHDTAKHLAHLRAALERHRDHALFARVEPLARDIRAALESMPRLDAAPLRVAHGDLKLNNLLFDESGDQVRVLALIDLDTVAPMPLIHEMGDALRSWANAAGEDEAEARIDLEICARAGRAYLDAKPRDPATDDHIRDAFVLGPELIAAELAARFAADALEESYFGWDRASYARAGEHNLVRAEGQWSLHRAFASTRERRRADLEVERG